MLLITLILFGSNAWADEKDNDLDGDGVTTLSEYKEANKEARCNVQTALRTDHVSAIVKMKCKEGDVLALEGDSFLMRISEYCDFDSEILFFGGDEAQLYCKVKFREVRDYRAMM